MGTPTVTVYRFSRASRIAHWVLAVPFLVLLATGLSLYVPQVKALHVGGYRLIPLVHTVTGVLLVPAWACTWLASPDRAELRSDLRRLFHFERIDLAWLGYAGYTLLGANMTPPRSAKFNAGQKLNTVASLAFTLGLVASGAVLAVNFFDRSILGSGFVERVFPFHDFFMIVAIPLIAGHIYLATLNPGTRASMRGMLDGRVNARWARSHHPAWVEEQESAGAMRTP
jgi:formate dehydrogenase subunit gamma